MWVCRVHKYCTLQRFYWSSTLPRRGRRRGRRRRGRGRRGRIRIRRRCRRDDGQGSRDAASGACVTIGGSRAGGAAIAVGTGACASGAGGAAAATGASGAAAATGASGARRAAAARVRPARARRGTSRTGRDVAAQRGRNWRRHRRGRHQRRRRHRSLGPRRHRRPRRRRRRHRHRRRRRGSGGRRQRRSRRGWHRRRDRHRRRRGGRHRRRRHRRRRQRRRRRAFGPGRLARDAAAGRAPPRDALCGLGGGGKPNPPDAWRETPVQARRRASGARRRPSTGANAAPSAAGIGTGEGSRAAAGGTGDGSRASRLRALAGGLFASGGGGASSVRFEELPLRSPGCRSAARRPADYGDGGRRGEGRRRRGRAHRLVPHVDGAARRGRDEGRRRRLVGARQPGDAGGSLQRCDGLLHQFAILAAEAHVPLDVLGDRGLGAAEARGERVVSAAVGGARRRPPRSVEHQLDHGVLHAPFLGQSIDVRRRRRRGRGHRRRATAAAGGAAVRRGERRRRRPPAPARR